MNKTIVTALLFCGLVTVSASARPGGVGTFPVDTVSQEATHDYDSLSSELSLLKSKVNAAEEEKHQNEVWKRKKYWKLGIASPDIKRTDGEAMAWDTDFSVFLQRGRTAWLHAKPLFGMVKIGIDYGFDIGYSKLKLKTAELSGTSSTQPGDGDGGDGFDDIVSDAPDGSVLSAMGIDLGMHKFEAGLHIGPSVSVNPWNHLIVSAYFHLMPAASGIVENGNFSYGFGCAMSAGVSVSYKCISAGVEGVWSTVKYKQSSFGDDGDDETNDNDGYDETNDNDGYDVGNLFTTKNFKLKQNGPRFYIALRF